MMCAFMTPVIKNDWEVYHLQKRSRNNSQSSHTSNRSQTKDLRRRVLSESRSLSYHGNGNMERGRRNSDFYPKPGPRTHHLSEGNSRNASSSSFSPYHTDESSPNNGASKSSSRKNSLKKFHDKVMHKLRNSFHSKESDKEEKDKSGDTDCDNKTEAA